MRRIRVFLKSAAFFSVGVALFVVIFRLEKDRPMMMLQRAGATMLTNQRGETFSLSLSGEEAGDAELRHAAKIKTLTRVNLAGSHVTAEGIASLKSLQSLEELDISETPYADGALAVVAQFPALRTLHVRRCDWLDDADLSGLAGAKSLEQLVVLDSPITDRGLSELGNLRRLTHLWLSSCEQITDDGIAHLDGLSRLEQISLDGCSRVTVDSLWRLAEHPAIEGISINDVPVDRVGISRFTTAFPAIQISLTELDATDLEPISRLGATVLLNHNFECDSIRIDGRAPGGVRDADLPDGARATSDGFREFVVPPRVPETGVDLSDVALIAEIADVAPGVRRLELRDVSLDVQDLEDLALLERLEFLALDAIDAPLEELNISAQSPRLRAISLSNVKVPEPCLRMLSENAGITHLELHDVALSPPEFSLITKAPNLERVSIRAASHPQECLSVLGQASSLQALQIIGRLPDEGLPWLADLDHLIVLRLHAGNLSLQACRDAASALQLEAISLNHLTIENEGFRELAGLPALNSVYLHNCRYDGRDLQLLRNARPDVLVFSNTRREGERVSPSPMMPVSGRSFDSTSRLFYDVEWRGGN